MKTQYCFLLLYIIGLPWCCKKASDEPTPGTYLIKVKEYKTNVPLANVKISLYRCSAYDNEFGCQSTSLFATRITDENDEYAITQGELNKADEGIVLSKSQYWDRNGGTGENDLEPEAWVNIALNATKDYPDTSLIDLTVSGESGLGSAKSFRAPKDSVVHFRLFGNETNEVKWVVYTKDLGCYLYCIRDTLAFGNLSFSPQRFETLTASIDY